MESPSRHNNTNHLRFQNLRTKQHTWHPAKRVQAEDPSRVFNRHTHAQQPDHLENVGTSVATASTEKKRSRRSRGGIRSRKKLEAKVPLDQGNHSQDDLPRLEETESELLVRAVHFFYDQQLQPLHSYVHRYVSTTYGVRWNLQKVKEVAENTQDVAYEEVAKSTGRYAILLRERERNFVDQQSREDPYSEELWEVFKQACGQLRGSPACTSAFSLAWDLRMRIPELDTVLLGKVCHMVHLAVHVRLILGYCDGHLVEYAESSDAHRRQRVQAYQEATLCEHGPVTWAELQELLVQLLRTLARPINLSALKALFNNKLQRELCEVALGMTRLKQVVIDPRLAPIIDLQERRGELVLSLPEWSACRSASSRLCEQQVGLSASTASEAQSAPIQVGAHVGAPQQSKHTTQTYQICRTCPACQMCQTCVVFSNENSNAMCSSQQLSPSTDLPSPSDSSQPLQSFSFKSQIRNTFLHFEGEPEPEPLEPSGRAVIRSSSAPVRVGSCRFF